MAILARNIPLGLNQTDFKFKVTVKKRKFKDITRGKPITSHSLITLMEYLHQKQGFTGESRLNCIGQKKMAKNLLLEVGPDVIIDAMLEAAETTTNRWSMKYITKIVKEDTNDKKGMDGRHKTT